MAKRRSTEDRAGIRMIPANKLLQKYGSSVNSLIQKIAAEYGYDKEEAKQSLIEALKHS